ncbi:hypothetical protein COLU111180_01380 [Cohnella lubricantis]
MSQMTDDALSDPLEQTTYGKTAYQAYQGIMENEKDDFSWAMLAFALSLMGYDDEMRIALARYALSGAPYNREMFAMGTFGFTKQARTLMEWLRLLESKRGVAADAKRAIADFVKDLSQQAAGGPDTSGNLHPANLQPEGMGVREWANRWLPLDMLRTMELSEAIARLGKLSEDVQTAEEAVRGLALLPDSNSGKWLRRICRNPAIAPEVQTKALLAMRGIGMTGNVKVVKLGNEYTVDLGDPQLKNDLPPELMQVYDWIAVWLLRAEGSIGNDEFEAYAVRGEPFPKELFDKTRAVFASPAMETVNRWLMDVYFYAFPDLPAIKANDRQAWGEAVLTLLQETSVRGETVIEYEAPPLSNAAEERRTWLAQAIGTV